MHKLSVSIIVSVLFILPKVGWSQTTEDSVRQTVITLFTGMKGADAALIQSAFADSAILQTLSRDKVTGKIRVRNESVQAFIQSISKLPVNAADERIAFNSIKIDADLASVWTPYQFYFNGKFSHCGVNSFQLVRINSEWKIQYLVDTRRTTNCNN